ELKNITEYGSSIGLDVDIGAMVLLSHGAPDDLRSFPTRRSSDLAKRLTDGASVAIKLLRTALAQDPRATDRLRREAQALGLSWQDRKSTRLNSSHVKISYAVFCLKKKNTVIVGDAKSITELGLFI